VRKIKPNDILAVHARFCSEGYNFPMKTPAKRLLQVWIACLAILLNALAPAFAHALPHGGTHGWEICLNDGTRLAGSGQLDRATFLALTDRTRPPPAELLSRIADSGGAKMAMADCGYCLAHAGGPGLPPAASLSVPAAIAAAERPYLFYHAPRPLATWAAAQPRGPPAYF
jgi:hypothetical protein